MNKAQLNEMILQLEDYLIKNKNINLSKSKRSEVNCWEINNCQKKSCPAYGSLSERCWHKTGTFCKTDTKKSNLHQKYIDCRDCPVFKSATTTNEARISEALLNIHQQISLFEYGEFPRSKISNDDYNKIAGSYKLTPREGEVMLLLLGNMTRKQISKKLFVSQETSKIHIKNLYKKTGVNSKYQLQDRVKEY